jgi:hypothetical protein
MSTTLRRRRPIPLRPDYSAVNGASECARAGAVAIIAHARDIAQRDAIEILEQRSATSPLTTASASALAPLAVSELIVSIATLSAAAKLITMGTQVDLTGVGSMRVPGRVTNAANAGTWTEEGQPIRMRAMSIVGPILVPNKLAVLTAFTREQAESSNIEALVKVAISESTGLALDAKMFSADAPTVAGPAGLLYNVAPITPAPGGGVAAMAADISALMKALGANGAGANPIIVAAVAQTTSLKLFAGPKFDISILAAAALPANTIIALEPSSFVSGFTSTPEFSTSTGAAMHEEDTTPAPIVGPAGTAAPVTSLFQTDAIGLKMILRAAFAMRGAHIAWIQNTSW